LQTYLVIFTTGLRVSAVPRLTLIHQHPVGAHSRTPLQCVFHPWNPPFADNPTLGVIAVRSEAISLSLEEIATLRLRSGQASPSGLLAMTKHVLNKKKEVVKNDF
jgi:hypothetical protein